MDLVALQYACMLNGVTQVVITKADVLDAFEELNICTSYFINGNETSMVPYQMLNKKIEPKYQAFKGWNRETSMIKNAAELPAEMTNYLDFINKNISASVSYISNGPGRDQIVKI
jgi:adenylosuccinate synthase